jgi:hypothetical protein
MTWVKILLASSFFLAAVPAAADHFSDNFADHTDSKSLEALTRDLGALMSAGSFHDGKALGFPLGLDIGGHVSFLDVDPENRILRDNGSTEQSQAIQLVYGLPKRINLIARVGAIENADVVGGGLRWGVIKSDTMAAPSVALSVLYNRAEHELFEANQFSGNLVASFDVPFIHPYVGAGLDRTELDGGGRTTKQNGYRVEAGINLSVIPFTYLTAGGGIANGRKMGHLGLGVRF